MHSGVAPKVSGARGGVRLWQLSAAELADLIACREISPVEVISSVLGRIEEIDPSLNAFCTVTPEEALRAAHESERRAVAGELLGRCDGVPFSVKDTIDTAGIRTTFGSRMTANRVPVEDAPAVCRMKAAGAVLIGKTNTPEYGWLGITDNELFGPTRNPWHSELTPGGSSGGAAAAVASGMGPIALGTDSGGSIRIPAAFCGVFGLKPTFGRVPLHPPSMSWMLAHVGPITRTSMDAALVLDVLSGPDARDPHSLPKPEAQFAAAGSDVSRLRIAWCPAFFGGRSDPEITTVCGAAVERLHALGAHIEEIAPDWPDCTETWRTLFVGGAAARLGPLLADNRDAIDPGLVELIEETAAWPPDRYPRACLNRLELAARLGRWVEDYDLLATPAVRVQPFPVGRRGCDAVDGDRLELPYGWMSLSPALNLTGQPAASAPCGFSSNGLPIGLQLVGRRLDEMTVLRVAAALLAPARWPLSA
jgi:aspartyl-tRNA(Asn)/glutamyl-tRNA(Gln) amidotransferase subunit A